MAINKKSPEYLAQRREKYKQERHKILPKLAEIRKANPKKFMLKDAKRRAKDKGLEFDLTEDDIILPEFCPITFVKLEHNTISLRQNSYSLDRIDNSKGYAKDNVAVISNRANAIKRDATLEEIKRLLRYMENGIDGRETKTLEKNQGKETR